MKHKITDWEKESKRFDRAVAYYDKYRPSYPKEIIDKIISISGIGLNAKILEIGAGSGKATELFVDRGYNITCVEPGEKLARKGMEKFNVTGQVEYKVTRLEEWEEIEQIYDLAISAQAFHWVPKPIGFEKLSQALMSRRYMALFWNMYVDDGSEVSKELSKVCKEYSVLFMNTREDLDKIKQRVIEEIEESNVFERPQIIEKPWQLEQSYQDFINFLSTGNGYLGLNDKTKLELESDFKKIFNLRNGKIIRRFNCILYISKKA